MINKLKNEKAITMITLVVTIILLVIVTASLASNAYISLQLSNLNKLDSDIEILNDRIAAYYVENGELPIYGNPVDISSYSITDVSRK